MAKRSSRVRRNGPTFLQRSRQVTAGEKARFHQIAGAGRARVRRPFLGLTPDEIETVRRRIEELLAERLRGRS
jgi:phage gpG-like protein